MIHLTFTSHILFVYTSISLSYSIYKDSQAQAPEVLQKVEWLRHNSHPATQVDEYMRATAEYRAKWVRENVGKDVLEVIKEFPHLLTKGMVCFTDQSILSNFPNTTSDTPFTFIYLLVFLHR